MISVIKMIDLIDMLKSLLKLIVYDGLFLFLLPTLLHMQNIAAQRNDINTYCLVFYITVTWDVHVKLPSTPSRTKKRLKYPTRSSGRSSFVATA